MCNDLADIIFESPSSLEKICINAITCTVLVSITIPKSVIQIDKSAFMSNAALTSIIFEDNNFNSCLSNNTG